MAKCAQGDFLESVNASELIDDSIKENCFRNGNAAVLPDVKIIHKLKAWSLRRQLVRQRAQNIADLRAGRTAARILRIRISREIRLAGVSNHASYEARLPDVCVFREKGIAPADGHLDGRISAIVRKMPKFVRRAA